MTTENPDEQQYLDLVERVLRSGFVREDRTGTGTKSLFGTHLRFSLSNGTMPLLTTKKVNLKSVAEELFWFLRGETSASTLDAKGVKIWNDNATRSFLDSRGLTYEEGELGPVYGFQWRKFGATYGDECSKGVDQISQVIEEIKRNPSSRRLVVSAWNPVDLDKMALPPCHLLFQFFVHDGRLSCSMYQRSADLGLGVPFNIASYALLTHLVARVCDLEAHELIITMGDTHVYRNHEEALSLQLSRSARPFPRVFLPKKASIDEYTLDDIELVGYDPHPFIPMKMAV